MKRVLVVLVTVTILELWALYIFREHPLIRPEWYSTLLLVIQLLMALGGIQASRWLLRVSPVARLEGPKRDWTKLWLWCGPVGGALLALFCILGKLITGYFNSLFIGWVVCAHIAGGAALWMIALPWALNDLFRDPTTGFRERLMMQVGIASHVLGLAVYFGFFPGPELKPISLLVAVYFFGAILYYLMAVTIVWSITFTFWQPRALTEEEAEANLGLHSAEDYVTSERENL